MITLREIEHEIRKFGLEYCDLPTMLENVSILLRVLTVNIDSKYHKGKQISTNDNREQRLKVLPEPLRKLNM